MSATLRLKSNVRSCASLYEGQAFMEGQKAKAEPVEDVDYDLQVP